MLELKSNKQLRYIWNILNLHMNRFNSQLHIGREFVIWKKISRMKHREKK